MRLQPIKTCSGVLLILCIALTGCYKNSCTIEPHICYTIPTRAAAALQSPFKPLNEGEKRTDWGKELMIGRGFAHEMDLYRALTCFKRARFLIPKTHERLIEIDYDIFLAYYLANKYDDAVETFETTTLMHASLETFPALHDLYIALYDAYIKTDHLDKAQSLLFFIQETEPCAAQSLQIEEAVIDADFDLLTYNAAGSQYEESASCFMREYCGNAKSAQKAQLLNAVLPGAGYLYVGQPKSALTSLIINALFIAASYQLFDRGYVAAGIITTSLEMGWYFGGINGAGLAAKEYNERLYDSLGREFLIENRLFPVLTLQMGF